MSTALVTAAAAGDTSAFSRLVEAHASPLCALTFALTGDLQEAEDAAQEAFVAAWTGLRRLENPASFGPWLRQIARRQCLATLRSARRRTARVTIDEGAVAAAGDPDESVPDALSRAEDRRLVEQALAELNEDAREIVLLYYREGCSTAHLAALLELEEPAVRQRLARARRQLRATVDARLELALRRSAPTAAFVAAVLALLRPAPAAASPWPARSLGVALLGVALLAPFGVATCRSTAEAPTEVVAAAPRARGPAGTRRSRHAAERAVPPPPSDRVALRVTLGDPGVLQRGLSLGAPFAPAEWFPAPDEAPLPPGEATTALQALLDQEAIDPQDRAGVHEGLESAFLDAAARQGLLPLSGSSDDPWATLTALEAERRREARAWTSAAEATGPLEVVIEDRVWPDHDLGALRSTARDLGDEHPDEVLADYAALYVLDVARQGASADTVREDFDAAVGLLGTTTDRRVEQAAGTVLPQLAAELGGVEASARAAIGEAFPGLDDPLAATELALWSLAGAVADGREDEVGRWRAEAARAVERLCASGDRVSCRELGNEVAATTGQVVVTIGGLPDTWRASLTAAVWSCELGEGPFVEPLRTTATFDGAWIFADPTPLTSCLSRQLYPIVPDPGTAVALTVERS